MSLPCRAFVAARAFCGSWWAGPLSSCGAWVSRCSGFSCCRRPRGLQWLRARELKLSGCSVCGLSCSLACGILLAQGSNPCPLYWQADSYPLGEVSAKLTLICGWLNLRMQNPRIGELAVPHPLLQEIGAFSDFGIRGRSWNQPLMNRGTSVYRKSSELRLSLPEINQV